MAHPATDYVREFTRDVDRARVLTAASIMTAATSITAPAPDAIIAAADTTVADLVPRLLDGVDTLTVTDEAGLTVGTVTRAAVRRVLAPESP